jgi:hypothetical protein
MPEPAGPDEPNHSKVRGKGAQSAVSSRGQAGARLPHTHHAADRSLRALIPSRQDTHVNYIFGAAYRDGPAGPAPAGTPRVRKSFSKGVRLPAWTRCIAGAWPARAPAQSGARGERIRRLWAGVASSLWCPA